MLTKSQIEEIKEILKSSYNFDLNLIAFEYGADLEEIKKLKKEAEVANKAHEENEVDRIIEQGKKALLMEKIKKLEKIKRMKTKYEEQIRPKKPTYTIVRRKLNSEQEKFVEELIKVTEQLVKENENNSNIERRKIANQVIANVQRIIKLKCDLAPEQNARLWHILDSKLFERIQLYDENDKIYQYLRRIKRMVSKDLGDSIVDAKTEANEDIEKLQALHDLITDKMSKEDYLNLSVLKNKLNAQINSIKSKRRQKELKNKVPEDIKEIIEQLAEGTIDVTNVETIIGEIVKQREKKPSQSRFNITDSDEKKVIMFQITKIFERTSL